MLDFLSYENDEELLQRCICLPKTKIKLFWTGQKDLCPIYFNPIQSKPQTSCLAILLAAHPFPVRGGARNKQDQFKQTTTALYTFPQ